MIKSYQKKLVAVASRTTETSYKLSPSTANCTCLLPGRRHGHAAPASCDGVRAGSQAERPKHNGRSIRLLDQVVDAVISRVDWHPVDAIVFPGGFFRSPVYVGNRSHSERAAALEALDFGQAVMAAAYRLDAAHPGALIVVGIELGAVQLG